MVWSLHVDQGLPDPLENCLRLQRVFRGIKRSQASLPANPRLPTSSNNFRIIHSALNRNSFDDHMFWAACLLAYFGFLKSAEFTILSLSAFQPSTLAVIYLCVVSLWMFPLICLASKSASKVLNLNCSGKGTTF